MESWDPFYQKDIPKFRIGDKACANSKKEGKEELSNWTMDIIGYFNGWNIQSTITV